MLPWAAGVRAGFRGRTGTRADPRRVVKFVRTRGAAKDRHCNTVIAKKWKQPKCPPTEEWMGNVGCHLENKTQ